MAKRQFLSKSEVHIGVKLFISEIFKVDNSLLVLNAGEKMLVFNTLRDFLPCKREIPFTFRTFEELMSASDDVSFFSASECCYKLSCEKCEINIQFPKQSVQTHKTEEWQTASLQEEQVFLIQTQAIQ